MLLKIQLLNKSFKQMVEKMKEYPIWVYKLLDEFAAGQEAR